MNKYQRLVITVAIIDLIVVLLFPPFVDRPLARNALPSFDGFYFLMAELGRRPIDVALLTLELFWIGANLLSAWLLLERPEGDEGKPASESKTAIGISIFAAVNLAVLCLFPPFEQYNSLLRATAPGFDSFYFIFGDRSARPLFLPLLHLEIFFVLINALALFLLFSAVQRGETAERERAAAAAENTAERGRKAYVPLETPEQRQLAEQKRAELLATLGRKEDRRHQDDAAYPGNERRAGHDRRNIA